MSRRRLRRWLQALKPGPAPAPARDVARFAIGAAVGIGLTALLMVLGQITQWRVAVLPVGLNALLLVSVGLLWHWFCGRRYPYQDSRLST